MPSLWIMLRLALGRRWSDWRDLVRDAPYDAPRHITRIAAPGPFVPLVRFAAAFPRLAALLASPSARPAAGLLEDRRLMLREFGGIAAMWRQPEDTWLLNLTSALVELPDAEGAEG